MVRCWISLVVIGTFAFEVAAQDKGGPKKPLLPDTIPEYKVHLVHGFTVAVHQDVTAADVKKYKRKPLEAVELDLKSLCGLLNDKGVEKLRSIPLWLEWDRKAGLNNGRAGEVFSVYYGTDKAVLVATGENPLKVGGVGVHRTRALVEVYNDTVRPDYLQLIHVYARAMHNQHFAADNAAIKAAYRQAMAAKLYDKSLYCTTEERAYFAEMSAAYLDQLYYFPRNRSDLQKHDPATFKLLDGIWSKYLADGNKVKAGRPADGSGEFRTDFKPADINLGPQLSGEKFDPKSCDGKVTAFVYWLSDDAPPLRWLKKWHDDLEPFGFQIVVLSADYRREPVEVVQRLEKLALPFPAVGRTFMPTKAKEQNWAHVTGHAAVCDSEGKWTFRGRLSDGEVFIREAVGRKILKDAELPDVPKAVQPAVTALTAGEPIPAVMAKLQPSTADAATATRDQARKLMDVLAKDAQKRLDKSAALAKEEPFEAYRIAEAVAAEYKGTPIGPKAEKLMSSLKVEKSVAAELKARKDLDAIKKLEADLNVQPGSFNPREPAFQKVNAAKLKEMKIVFEQMRKAHPNARATAEAEAIVKEFVG